MKNVYKTQINITILDTSTVISRGNSNLYLNIDNNKVHNNTEYCSIEHVFYTNPDGSVKRVYFKYSQLGFVPARLQKPGPKTLEKIISRSRYIKEKSKIIKYTEDVRKLRIRIGNLRTMREGVEKVDRIITKFYTIYCFESLRTTINVIYKKEKTTIKKYQINCSIKIQTFDSEQSYYDSLNTICSAPNTVNKLLITKKELDYIMRKCNIVSNPDMKKYKF